MSTTRLLQLTDLHLFRDPQETLYGIPTCATLQMVVDSIVASGIDFDQVIVTGDHTHDEQPETYQAVREILEPWLDRLSVVPGNHDDRNVMRSVLADVINRQSVGSQLPSDRINFSILAGAWQLLGIDTHLPGEVAGHVGNEQLRWLSETLDQHAPHPVIVFCHHPPVEIGSIWMDKIGITDRDAFVRVLNDYPCVRLVCCGHVHHEFEGQLQHARVVATPSTGLQFDPAGLEPSLTDDAPGYRIIELSEDKFTTQVHRAAKPGVSV